MNGSAFPIASEKHRGKLCSDQWTLCIGAGVSQQIVPTWLDLTRRVVNESFKSDYSRDEFEQLANDLGWSLDAWIQASSNEFRSSDRSLAEFHELLEEALYGKLLRSADEYGLRKHLSIALKNPRHLNKDYTIQVANFIEEQFGETSLMRLARLLISCVGKNKLPYAIITFNADTLLHTAIELIQRRDHFLDPPPHSHPSYSFKTVLRSLGGVPQTKTPIYHIHGAIKPDASSQVTKGYDSRDKLMFLEEDYLRAATNTSSWPEVNFAFHSQASNLVFVGLSMSDTNLRRWLSSSYKIMAADIQKVAGVEKFTPPHIWITTRPDSSMHQRAKAIGLSHLGVRAGWLEDWSQIKTGMENLLAM